MLLEAAPLGAVNKTAGGILMLSAFAIAIYACGGLDIIANTVLRALYPVATPKDTPAIPTIPFKLPNGHGTEKFFDGRRAARRWRAKYGPVYSIWSGFKREVVLSEPEHVRDFFKDSHLHVKAVDNNSGWLFGELLGSCVGLVSQQQWKRVRKPFEGHFSRPSSVKRPEQFVHEAAEFIRGMRDGKNDHLVINPTNELKYCPFFMVASMFFGKLTKEQRRELSNIGPLRERLFRDTFLGGINRYSFARYLPGSAMSRLRDFQQRWEAFVRAAYEHAMACNEEAAILSLWRSVQNGDITMQELLQTLDESLFANLDVTAHALSWNVLCIAQHADCQQQVRTEIQSYIDKEQYENYLCRDDTLLAAGILETSRLHPILPFSNPEAANQDKIVGSHLIPMNTDVIVDAFAINVDNSYWKDASKFDPHRHMGDKDQARRYNMWRFGFGPRQCLGKNVADIILRVIVAELLKLYELKLIRTKDLNDVGLQAESWIGLPDGLVEMTSMR